MIEEEILNRITDMVSERPSVDYDKITKNLNFQNDLNTGSIDFVELVMNLKDTFGAKIPDDDAGKLQAVDEAVEYIKNY